MGQIYVKKIGSSVVQPNATRTFYWNNPNINYVYAVNVVPKINIGYPGTKYVEVLAVRFYINANTWKRRIYFRVKNLKNVSTPFDVVMSYAKP